MGVLLIGRCRMLRIWVAMAKWGIDSVETNTISRNAPTPPTSCPSRVCIILVNGPPPSMSPVMCPQQYGAGPVPPCSQSFESIGRKEITNTTRIFFWKRYTGIKNKHIHVSKRKSYLKSSSCTRRTATFLVQSFHLLRSTLTQCRSCH